MKFMKKEQKKMSGVKNEYYFGGPVPREIQERLEGCRDRGMRNQDIARKLAYLWVALPEEKQNQLYFSMIDVDFDPKDPAIADLLSAVDALIFANLLNWLPESAKLSELAAEVLKRPARRSRKTRPPEPK